MLSIHLLNFALLSLSQNANLAPVWDDKDWRDPGPPWEPPLTGFQKHAKFVYFCREWDPPKENLCFVTVSECNGEYDDEDDTPKVRRYVVPDDQQDRPLFNTRVNLLGLWNKLARLPYDNGPFTDGDSKYNEASCLEKAMNIDSVRISDEITDLDWAQL